MGAGSYSYAAYSAISDARGLASATTEALFKNRHISVDADIKTSNVNARLFNTEVKKEAINVGVRECRDTEEHPDVTPIIIALDVTGSMRNTPHTMLRDQFPKIMGVLQQLNVKDPQILFMAVGDHEWDRYPIQVCQFESDTTKLVDSLQTLVLEGGGGPNYGESYLLAWLIAGYHTETDAWYKRGKKGYLFTIGDEETLRKVDEEYLSDGLGYQKGIGVITAKEALKKAKEQYNVFHIHITDGSRGSTPRPSWRSYLGQNVLTSDSKDIHTVIGEVISKHEGINNLEVTDENSPSNQEEANYTY